MLNKLILGTANFTQNYGILHEGQLVENSQIELILQEAIKKGLDKIDTAFAYGNLFDITANKLLAKFKIITKISVKDSLKDIEDKFFVLEKNNIYAVLIHDPQNIPSVDKKQLKEVLNYINKELKIEKIGASIYDYNDLEKVKDLFVPSILQIPLNPLNQIFNRDDFKKYTKENSIEIHGRSLFLQGVLLSDFLPKNLEHLKEKWLLIRDSLKNYGSILQGLMNWAFQQDWVNNWVLGVNSLKDFQEILNASQNINDNYKIEFDIFDHPLIDPRNW